MPKANTASHNWLFNKYFIIQAGFCLCASSLQVYTVMLKTFLSDFTSSKWSPISTSCYPIIKSLSCLIIVFCLTENTHNFWINLFESYLYSLRILFWFFEINEQFIITYILLRKVYFVFYKRLGKVKPHADRLPIQFLLLHSRW